MKNKRQKYRLAIIFLSLFYINFFVFIPYFHHHHSSNTKSHHNSNIVFSFLASDCCEVTCESKHDHNLELDESHSHKDEICTKNNITQSWDNPLNFKSNKSAQFTYKGITKDPISNGVFFEQSIHLITWQKLVHKAANTSPPIS